MLIDAFIRIQNTLFIPGEILFAAWLQSTSKELFIKMPNKHKPTRHIVLGSFLYLYSHLSGTNSSHSFISDSGTFLTWSSRERRKQTVCDLSALAWWTHLLLSFSSTHHQDELVRQLHDGNLEAAAHIVGLSREALLGQQQEGVDHVVDEQEVPGFGDYSLNGAEAQQGRWGWGSSSSFARTATCHWSRSDALTISCFSAATRGISEWPEILNIWWSERKSLNNWKKNKQHVHDS